MTRCARTNNVFFCEEPVFDAAIPYWDISFADSGVRVAVPHLPSGLDAKQAEILQTSMVKELFENHRIKDPILWFYTPMAFPLAVELGASVVIYDCMDELSAFRGAPPGLSVAEAELLKRADLVFTGGQSLFEVKRSKHPSVHCFPSSIDRDFFGAARSAQEDPQDQASIPHPRLGYAGVIDERMDLNLLAGIADARPAWNLVLIGPVVKINPDDLPQRSNIHYLSSKPYSELPKYMANWDVGLLPFALNESTRFISPTKTPEYLAAGLPVVSSPIVDVIRPYGDKKLVHIADGVARFVSAIELALSVPRSSRQWSKLDKFLAENSWDQTWERMASLIREVGSATVSQKTFALKVSPRSSLHVSASSMASD